MGYQVNTVDFLSLLDTQITLFNYDIDLARRKRDHGTALAHIETLVGLDAPAIRRRAREASSNAEVSP